MAMSISISSNLESVSTTRHALSFSLPFSLRTVKTTQRVMRGTNQAPDQHRHWIERWAVRVLGGGRAQRIVQEAGREAVEMGGHAEIWRLEAPGRDKPGIDQHQRRKLRPDVREVGSDLEKCSAAGRLRVT